jgi:MFS family permease
MKAKDDMRASAQAMLTFFTLGVGNYLGTLFTGWIWEIYTSYKVDDLGQLILDEKNHKIPIYDWSSFFLIPGLLCTVMAIIFLLFFKDDTKASEAELKTI